MLLRDKPLLIAHKASKSEYPLHVRAQKSVLGVSSICKRVEGKRQHAVFSTCTLYARLDAQLPRHYHSRLQPVGYKLHPESAARNMAVKELMSDRKSAVCMCCCFPTVLYARSWAHRPSERGSSEPALPRVINTTKCIVCLPRTEA